MAKMNKKFVATSLTAAMVATAIAPVAGAAFTDSIPTYAKDAVTYVADKGIMTGSGDGTFNAGAEITRAEVAQLLAKALKLDTAGKKANFTDVPADHWATGAIAAVVEKGIAKGTGEGFNPSGKITRQEAAVMFANAYKAELNKETTVNFSDLSTVASWAKNEVTILSSLGIFGGKDGGVFAPTANITRAEVATLVHRSEVKEVRIFSEVSSVKALNSNTIELTGKSLNLLEKGQLKLAGNTISTITPAADGKSATVKFESAFIPNADLALVVNVKKEETFNFKFTYGVLKAELVDKTYDNDTKNQKLTLNVNGAAADYNSLLVAGYTVKYVALDKDGVDVSSTFFKSNPSTTGLLADSLTVGDYKVEVTIYQGSEIIVSDSAAVKVRNLDLAATAITEYELTNLNSTVVGTQNSTTLVMGETAQVTELTVTANNAEYDVTTGYSVKSSNPAIISVDSAGVLTANTPGTATITITYGDVKKDITLTVASQARKVTKVTSNKSLVTLVGTAVTVTDTVTLSAVDQYGDLLVNKVITVENPDVIGTIANATSGSNGKATITVTAAKAGSGTVILKSEGTTVGSFAVRVSQYNNVASSKLEIVQKPTDATYTKDFTLDLDADLNLEVALNNYNTENIKNGSEDLSTYKVRYNADFIQIGSDANLTGHKEQVIGTSNLSIIGKKTGSTTVAVYDDQNKFIGQFTVTIVNTGYSITGVAFKQVPLVDYKGKAVTVTDVLDIVESNKDDIVKGITLSKPTAHAIRIQAVTGLLYIDADGDGELDAGEAELGTVSASVVSGGSGTFAAAVPTYDIFAGIATVASGDKGTIVFKVMKDSRLIANTSVTINVK